MRASYKNPRGPIDGERVIRVDPGVTGFDVTTEHMGSLCIYRGCEQQYEVGAVLDRHPASRTCTIIPRHWSPFDGQEDD